MKFKTDFNSLWPLELGWGIKAYQKEVSEPIPADRISLQNCQNRSNSAGSITFPGPLLPIGKELDAIHILARVEGVQYQLLLEDIELLGNNPNHRSFIAQRVIPWHPIVEKIPGKPLIVTFSYDLSDYIPRDNIIKQPLAKQILSIFQKCECGAESCGYSSHSDYCPKYKK